VLVFDAFLAVLEDFVEEGALLDLDVLLLEEGVLVD
jgi:hypothetical protein